MPKARRRARESAILNRVRVRRAMSESTEEALHGSLGKQPDLLIRRQAARTGWGRARYGTRRSCRSQGRSTSLVSAGA